MKKSLRSLIDEYVRNAELHGTGTNEGNYKLVNKCHDKIIETLKEIREFGDDGNKALLSLLQHHNDSVRCWAATHMLKYEQNAAKDVLKELSKKSDLISFDAEMVLKEWEKGTLKLP